MTKKNARSGDAFGAKSVLLGLLISCLCMLAVSLLCAVILYIQGDPLALVDLASLAVLLVSAAISGYIISRRSPEKKLLTVTLSSLLLCLLLFVIGMILTGGGVTTRVYLNYLCYVGVALLFAWLASRKPERKRRRR